VKRDTLSTSLKMPVRRDSFSQKLSTPEPFRLRSALSPIRMNCDSPFGSSPDKLKGRSTVDMISQVLDDLELFDTDHNVVTSDLSWNTV